MLHLHDRASMAHALTLDLDPVLASLLAERIVSLVTSEYDLTDHTEFLIVEPGDGEADIVAQIGFSPLMEPIEGAPFGSPLFHPFWDWLADRSGWFEMIISFGSAFAYVLLIKDDVHLDARLLALCREYAHPIP
jgi:hypothetical protein